MNFFLRFFLLTLVISAGLFVTTPALDAAGAHTEPAFVTEMTTFSEQEAALQLTGVGERLAFRAREIPFLVCASIIFLLAILHTFFAVPITRYAHRVQHEHDARIRRENAALGEITVARDMASFKATILHFFGEVEAVFGIWVAVLIGTMFAFYDLDTVKGYIMNVNFTEPMFVVIIMALASTRPVLRFAESPRVFNHRTRRHDDRRDAPGEEILQSQAFPPLCIRNPRTPLCEYLDRGCPH